ncbi:EndoU domain-containing protein [Streptomyces sp. NRRL F-2664]|uniref:EndoU domain-containing protein n=1 Tax=Streptomyces sp. NRRL F-2664 TaxID=1463842 RepID=UPI0006897352|nr:EndoU domain-containing protein [Streptomyces sp. NRRL F-2664]
MIDVGKIPTFTGNLETLETHAAALKTTASSIRGTGRDVHTAFQALDAVYDAPEQEELLDSTIPVRDRADAFATKLESVSGALTTFASSARPLVDRMKQLRTDAEKFVADNKDDEDWQQDQGKIDENARLVREVGVTWVAFQGVERDAANKITTLVGGTHFVVDDGSHKAGMYGFKESDVKDAKETPWGTADEREYTGLRAAWEWTKDNVGSGLKGFFVDGVWGTLKGLGNMVNVFDMDTFKKTWSGIGDVFAGVSGYIITPYDWAMDKMFGPVDHSDREKSKAALRNFGKSLVAWDEWGKDPARAGGTVVFNVLTIGAGSFLKLGKAGKMGVGAEIATAVGKAGVLVDPMSYLGKAANVTKIKVGDFMEGLKASRAGVDDMARGMPGGTSPHPTDTAAPPVGAGDGTPPGYEYADPQGNKRVIGRDGIIRDEHGNVVRDTEPVREPHKDDLPNTHEPTPVKERVLEGAGGPSRVENSTGHPTNPAHSSGGSHAPGGHAGAGPTAHVPAHDHGHTSSGAGHGTPHTGAGGGSSGSSGHGTGQHDPAGHGSGSGHAGDPHDPAGHGDSAHDPADPGTGADSGSGHTGDTATPQQDPPTVEELPPLPKGGRIPEHTFEHVIRGELKYDRNGNPKVSGYHFRPDGRDLNPYMVKVPRIIEIDHRTGLTTGNVWMRDPRTGEMVMKRAKTTFFPPGWSEKQVRRAMEKSFENGRVVDAATNKWRGDWKGITFEGYFDPITGDAKTIYPLMPK